MEGRVYTISEFTRLVKSTIEEAPGLSNAWVVGELSNITYHSSGHIYLTLKDESALLSAVFFKYANRRLNFRLEEGMKVFALGSLNVFEKRGSYQFIITQLRLEGVGELQKRIEQLKARLLTDGLFDPSAKKALPSLPCRLGIVTSPTGAALRDIIKVARRRFPNIEILIAPSIVQGDDAPESIAAGIFELNKPEYGVDVIIAGRGGGSFEDLMAFNEEIVVRAFFNSRVPIVSAVGHQVDHPLCDFAADVAAPTPSAAAEIAIPVKDELSDYIFNLRGRAHTSLLMMLRDASNRLSFSCSRRVFSNPHDIVINRTLQVSENERRIITSLRDVISRKRNLLLSLPTLNLLIKNILKDNIYRYSMLVQSLDQLSPLSILGRGYSITVDKNRNIVKSITSVFENDPIRVFLHDGSLDCTINTKRKGDHLGKEKTEIETDI